MRVRACTIGVPHFQHDGLVVGKGWTALDVDEMAPPARAALLAYTGRFVQIHPDDVAKLPEAGLELRGGKLVEVEVAAPPSEPPPGDDDQGEGDEADEKDDGGAPAFDTTDVDTQPARPAATSKRKR